VQEKSAGKTTEKAPEKIADKESECDISILNIQVGLIRKAWKHPSADRCCIFTLLQHLEFLSVLML
jgi:aminoacyl tRNA synthase complex-interacting multifunctional protein 1